METKQNDSLTNFFYATHYNNNIKNDFLINFYKVTFNSKGWVYKPCKQRNLEFMGETIEELLAKHNNYDKKYLYNIIFVLGQEEGLANMTTPKTIGRLYRAVFKCVYNNEFFHYYNIFILKVGNALKEIALYLCHGEELICYNNSFICYWRCHPNLNRIVTV